MNSLLSSALIGLGLATLAFVVFYGLVMATMCGLGVLLAKRTQGMIDDEIRESPAADLIVAGRVAHTRHEFRLNRAYLVLLFAGLILFYAALPFVALGMLIVFLFSFALALGSRNSGAHDDLLRASGGGLGAIIKALFARTDHGSFGVRKTRRQCPRLFDAIDEVAERIDTEPPDEVWISPGAMFAVHQEGRGPFGMFGSRKRVLTLGLCVMSFLTVGELKGILAHEFAHFSHADTVWSRFLFQVTLSRRIVLRDMARTGGWVTWFNPFYLFFWCFGRSYDLLAAGFSRSREFLADRMACVLFGSDVFVSGLRKVCTDGSHFERVIYDNIARLLRRNQAFVNMYLAFRRHRDENLTAEQRSGRDRDLLAGEPSLFASHPTFGERVRACRRLPPALFTDDASALSLFDDIERIECELTDFLTHALANR